MSVRLQKILICFALAFGTASVYWPVHHYEFVNYDDMDYVAGNAHVRAGLTLHGLRWAFTTGEAANWHPLTWLSHMTDVQLFGLNAGLHHVVNLLFHIANTVLIFLVLARMTRGLWASAAVAALFAWHPLHVESVAWIAERKDVLSTFFALLSLWAYARYAESNRRKHLLLALLCFAFGLMAKPMLVTLPFIFLLLDYWPLQRSSPPRPGGEFFAANRHLILEKLPFFVLTAASSVVTYAVQRNGGAVAAIENLPLRYRLMNALLAYAAYLQKTLLPLNLAVIYPVSRIVLWWQIAAALTLLIAISVAAIYWARRRPWLLVGWLWFLGMLVPVIGLIQVGNQAMADRYTYLPLVGVFIILVSIAAEAAARSRFALKLVSVTSIVMLSATLMLTSTQTQTWSNSQTLFEHAIAVTTDNYIAHCALGGVFAHRGQLDQAQAHFEQALRIVPNESSAHFGLGVIFAQEGRSQEAIAHYLQAIQTKADARTHYNLGNTLMQVGRFDEAIAHFMEAVRLDPQMAEAQNNWAYALTTQGRLREAAGHYNAALQIQPDLLEARLNLARIREELGARDVSPSDSR